MSRWFPKLCTALCAGLCCCTPAAVQPRGNVILVVIDTLRADALSLYGNPRPTTPELERLFAKGVLFEQALALAPNTATSHATLFTGLPPWEHRVANLTSLEQGTAGLPDAFDTLAERFGRAGWQTAAFTDGGPLGTAWNLMQGFERLEARYEGVAAKVDQTLAFLEHGRDSRPLFLFLHTYEVHQPYLPSEDWRARFAGDYQGPILGLEQEARAQRAQGAELQPDGKILLRGHESFGPLDIEHLHNLYLAEVAYTDHELGRLWAALESSGELEHSLVVLTSDHGEEFHEHGEFGHVQLFRESLHVPLVLRLPAAPFEGLRRIEQPVGLDLLGSLLLGLCGAEDSALEGNTLYELLLGERALPRLLRAETTEHLYPSGRDLPWRRALRDGERSLLSTKRGEQELLELFERDPLELQPSYRVLRPGGTEVGSAAARAVALGLADSLEQSLLASEADRLRLLAGQSTVLYQSADQALLEEWRKLGYTGD